MLLTSCYQFGECMLLQADLSAVAWQIKTLSCAVQQNWLGVMRKRNENGLLHLALPNGH